jgi:elongation factor Ts
MVKELRERTGAGVLECKKALEEFGGDFDKAAESLRVKGLAIAARKVDRVAREGLIEAYVHGGGRVASLVELNCETDFVARTQEFRTLAHDLAMQVVAAEPQYLAPADVPSETLAAKRAEFYSEAQGDGRAGEEIESIVAGRLEKYLAQVCLLRQPFIKDERHTVQELINDGIAKLGENIVVRRFVRYELGS